MVTSETLTLLTQGHETSFAIPELHCPCNGNSLVCFPFSDTAATSANATLKKFASTLDAVAASHTHILGVRTLSITNGKAVSSWLASSSQR